MAVRRTIDSLVEDFASMRGVSKDNAVYIALTDAIAREEEPEFLPVAKEIVMRRVWIAYMDGQDNGSNKVFEEIAIACVMLTLFLILGLFAPGMRVGLIGFVIIVSVVSLYSYFRITERRKEERSKSREAIINDIAEMKNDLPTGLEFLTGGPTYMDVFLSSFEEERDSTQATR
jgi:hypothetical protein